MIESECVSMLVIPRLAGSTLRNEPSNRKVDNYGIVLEVCLFRGGSTVNRSLQPELLLRSSSRTWSTSFPVMLYLSCPSTYLIHNSQRSSDMTETATPVEIFC